MQSEGVHIHESTTKIGPISLAMFQNRLCWIDFGSWTETRTIFEKWTGKAGLPDSWLRDDAAFTAIDQQIDDYLAGKRHSFDCPILLIGTEFQKKVWRALETIPYGETRTYSDIAAQIGKPGASRAVGGANNKNPLPLIIPCHRVIGKDGTLTGYGGGLEIKQALLEIETQDLTLC
ncbi:methylated-DNA--[protein]-cysteine S-methyltransferase [Sporolactobacillus spathodeae]|uniref:Methylated-DNA--protein-cysteine methyltransferase n=1 Tax=Sporolactobacillus spathodeae TaxID=1465502 RepID=A0ABS2QB17_9BACL|nr:methylated-DNA--[protein]-cysteine S-methyltransferase [Sporolactobacillus spathodeae]MBM7658997.1 O-6-methylguanine DNA methyltransferase [Sporolactobacillus spathodeae]